MINTKVRTGALFALSRFRAREREAIKSAKARRKKRAKKQKRRVRKNRELALFSPFTLDGRFQSRGKSKGLE